MQVGLGREDRDPFLLVTVELTESGHDLPDVRARGQGSALIVARPAIDDPGMVQDLDRRKDELDPAVRDTVDWAKRGALDRRNFADEDVARVRAQGYDDGQPVEVATTAVIAYVLSAINQTFDLREREV